MFNVVFITRFAIHQALGAPVAGTSSAVPAGACVRASACGRDRSLRHSLQDVFRRAADRREQGFQPGAVRTPRAARSAFAGCATRRIAKVRLQAFWG